jgi:hypothetical protein
MSPHESAKRKRPNLHVFAVRRKNTGLKVAQVAQLLAAAKKQMRIWVEGAATMLRVAGVAFWAGTAHVLRQSWPEQVHSARMFHFV